jgi:hypothetical protein
MIIGVSLSFSQIVMAGTLVRPPAGPSVNLVPGIHDFLATKTWIAGTSLAMTPEGLAPT